MSINFYQKNKGAVSVFLVIILVPVLLISSLFVDLGRVQLGEAVVASAQDVALNTLLTQYDADLKEYYGFMGSCQNISDYYETAENCFRNSVKSQYMDDTELDTIWTSVSNTFKPKNPDAGSIVDLLQITERGSGVKVGAIKDANLAKPTFIKTQIVEFMKYRAPINLVSGQLGKLLENLKGSANDLKNAEEDKKLIDSKEDFLVKEADLLEYLQEIYDEICEYQNLGITDEYCKQVISELNGYKEKFKAWHIKMFKDLFNTENLRIFNHFQMDIGTYQSETYQSDICSEYIVPTESNDGKKNRVNSSLYSLAERITNFYKAKKELEEVMNQTTPQDVGTGSGQAYNIQYWRDVTERLNSNDKYEKFKSSVMDMYKSYSITMFLYNEYSDLCSGGDLSRLNDDNNKYGSFTEYFHSNYSGQEMNIKNCYLAAVAQVESIHTKYFYEGGKLNTDNSDTYKTVVSKLESISSDNIYNISSDGLDKKIKEVYSYISEVFIKFEKAKKILTSVSKKLGSDKLKKLIDDYNKSYEKYKGLADKSQTELGQKEKAELDSMKDVVENVTIEGVEALKARIDNIQNQVVEKIYSYIKSMKYQNTEIIKINGYAVFKDASDIEPEDIVIEYSILDENEKKSFHFEREGNDDLRITINKNNNPDITVEPIPLYTWMKTKFRKEVAQRPEKYGDEYQSEEDAKEDFGGSDSSKKEEADKTDNDNISVDSKASDIKKTYQNIAENFPSAFKGDAVGILDICFSLFRFSGKLLDDFDGSITSLRDTLFTTDYVIHMFTYNTFEEEGLVQLALKKEPYKSSGIGYDNIKNVKDSVRGNANDKARGTWYSEDYQDTYNKSLTNKMLNAENNFAYLAEVEYILKGGENSENIRNVLLNIYAIRLSLNAVPCFMKFWDNSELKIFANFISVLSRGVVPEKLVRTLCIIITIAAESYYDIQILQEGLSVPLIKNEKQIIANNPIVPVADYSQNPPTYASIFDKGADAPLLQLSYSDYLMVFLILGLSGGDEKEMSDIYARIGDVIQANMMKLTSSNEYKLSNSIEFFEISSDMRVNPLLMDLPLFSAYDTPNASSPSGWCDFSYTSRRGY